MILFEATVVVNTETGTEQRQVILNYAIKFQIKNNNGEAAKKRRKLDIDSNIGIFITIIFRFFLNYFSLSFIDFLPPPIQQQFQK
jgi:hypothetical protein